MISFDSNHSLELRNQIQFFLDVDWHRFSCYTVRDRAKEYGGLYIHLFSLLFYLGCLTLVHGDVWINNILIKQNRDGSISNTVGGYIDWQMAFEGEILREFETYLNFYHFSGNPLYDISRLITTYSDADIRRAVAMNAVDIYYDRLTKKLKGRF